MKHFLFIVLALIGISFTSCEPESTTNEPMTLVGNWVLSEINFTSDHVTAWHSDTYKSDAELFGWAPFMQGYVSGVVFSDEDYTDETSGKFGKICTVVTHSSKPEFAGIFWIWNAPEDYSSVELTQLNNHMPPYNFSWTSSKSLQVSKLDGKNMLTIQTTLNSIDQDRLGEGTRPMAGPLIKVDATLTLVQANTVDRDLKPVLKLNGEAFNLPVKATAETADRE